MTGHARLAEAYHLMAREARYRPAAPGDGLGNVSLTAEELRDPERLKREAQRYADGFLAEEDSRQFWIGCSKYQTNRAFVLGLEALRVLAGANDDLALKLFQLAVRELAESPRNRLLPAAAHRIRAL